MSDLNVFYALGGNGQGKEHKTGLKLADKYRPGVAATRAWVKDTFLPIFKTALTAQMVCYSQTVSDDRPNLLRWQKYLPTTMDENVVGTRAAATPDLLADLEIVAVFELLAEGGRPGRMELRGALLKSEVEVSINGDVSLKGNGIPAWITNFATAMKGICDQGDVLLGPGGDKRTGNRPIIDVQWAGVERQPLTNSRSSPAAKRKAALKSELIDMSNSYKLLQFDDDGNPVVPTAEQDAEYKAKATAISAANGGKANVMKAKPRANIAKFFK